MRVGFSLLLSFLCIPFLYGKKITLQPNVVNGKNILLQEQFTSTDATYVVLYDFDLNGATLAIPSGCTLKFKNGTISNGVLTGNVCNKYLKPEWFGGKPIETIDSRQAIQNCINLCRETRLEGVYYCGNSNTISCNGSNRTNVITLLSGKKIKGYRDNAIYKVTPDENYEKGYSLLHLLSNSIVDHVNFKCTNLAIETWTGKCDALVNCYADSVTIKSCSFRNLLISAIKSDIRKNIRILDNYFEDCDCGYIMQGTVRKDTEVNLVIKGNIFEGNNNPYSEPISLYDTCGKDVVLYGFTILNNKLYNKKNSGGIFIGQASGSTKKNILIKGNKLSNCGTISLFNCNYAVLRNNSVYTDLHIQPVSFYNCEYCTMCKAQVSCLGANLRIENSSNINIEKTILNRIDDTSEDAYLSAMLLDSHDVVLQKVSMTRKNKSANVGIRLAGSTTDIQLLSITNKQNKFRTWRLGDNKASVSIDSVVQLK